MLEKGQYFCHFFAVRPQAKQMIIHFPKLYNLVIPEVSLYNDLDLLVQLIQIFTFLFQQISDFTNKR